MLREDKKEGTNEERKNRPRNGVNAKNIFQHLSWEERGERVTAHSKMHPQICQANLVDYLPPYDGGPSRLDRIRCLAIFQQTVLKFLTGAETTGAIDENKMKGKKCQLFISREQNWILYIFLIHILYILALIHESVVFT